MSDCRSTEVSENRRPNFENQKRDNITCKPSTSLSIHSTDLQSLSYPQFLTACEWLLPWSMQCCQPVQWLNTRHFARKPQKHYIPCPFTVMIGLMKIQMIRDIIILQWTNRSGGYFSRCHHTSNDKRCASNQQEPQWKPHQWCLFTTELAPHV